MNLSVFIDGSSRVHDAIALTANQVMKVRITRVPIKRLEREFIISSSNEVRPIPPFTDNGNAGTGQWNSILLGGIIVCHRIMAIRQQWIRRGKIARSHCTCRYQ